MDLFEAVESRYSCRAYLDKPVDPGIVRELIERAGRTASNANLQPWRVHALMGRPLEKLKRAAALAVADQNPHENVTEFDVFPNDLWEPYGSRRETQGAELYGAIEVDRTDLEKRLAWYRRNFEFFGAPVGLIFCIERKLGLPQWADLGSYIHTIMLLARGYGLETCAQVAWSRIYGTVETFLDLPPDQMVYSGMAIGYADPDHPANNFRMPRAAADEVCRFHGFK